MVALALSALAAPTDFHAVSAADGCTVYTGPVGEDGIATLRAECHWPDGDFEVLDAALSRVDRWEDLVWCIADSAVVGRDGDRALVWQRHEVSGIAARENLVWMRSSGDGTLRRYEWTQAGVGFDAAADAVVPLRNDGFWQVSRAADGGVDVVHEITYDPAGQVPAWLVRWFQRRGALTVLADVHALAQGRL